MLETYVFTNKLCNDVVTEVYNKVVNLRPRLFIKELIPNIDDKIIYNTAKHLKVDYENSLQEKHEILEKIEEENFKTHKFGYDSPVKELSLSSVKTKDFVLKDFKLPEEILVDEILNRDRLLEIDNIINQNIEKELYSLKLKKQFDEFIESDRSDELIMKCYEDTDTVATPTVKEKFIKTVIEEGLFDELVANFINTSILLSEKKIMITELGVDLMQLENIS